MNWKDHSALIGTHALLSASSYGWTNYDDNKLVHFLENHDAKERGTQLHEFASTCIKLKQKLPKNNKALNMFVNDCIGFRMRSEQILYFSPKCYGTTDAISYSEKAKLLRISDFKSGTVKASFRQLEVYAALFCLEYSKIPFDMTIEMRLYQYDSVEFAEANPNVINEIMNKIIQFDDIIEKWEGGEISGY